MWKRTVEQGRLQIDNMALGIACWIPKVTNTHSVYVILIAFSLQQWLKACASVLRDTSVALSCFLQWRQELSLCFEYAARVLKITCHIRWLQNKSLKKEEYSWFSASWFVRLGVSLNFITSYVLRKAHILYQREINTELNIVFHLLLSSLWLSTIDAYLFFLVVSSLISYLLTFFQ